MRSRAMELGTNLLSAAASPNGRFDRELRVASILKKDAISGILIAVLTSVTSMANAVKVADKLQCR